MRILSYCRHKTAGWEGVIFQEDDGQVWITNGPAIWNDSEKRRASLETVAQVDLAAICKNLERYQLNQKLADMLREMPDAVLSLDQAYLTKPLLTKCCYEISDRKIRIWNNTNEIACARAPLPALDRATLLERYQRILKTARERKIKISFRNHFHKKIKENWERYLAEDVERRRIYQELYGLALQIQQRGIHIGYRDDYVLQDWYRVHARYEELSDWRSACDRMEEIARELARLEQAFSDGPELYGPENKIYL